MSHTEGIAQRCKSHQIVTLLLTPWARLGVSTWVPSFPFIDQHCHESQALW